MSKMASPFFSSGNIERSLPHVKETCHPASKMGVGLNYDLDLRLLMEMTPLVLIPTTLRLG
jgi:hypothetical protein